MKDLLVEKFVATFKKEFPSATVVVQKLNVGGSQIHSVFVGNLDVEELKNDWVRITNFIAIQYQSNLNTDYERWNLYLFFLLPNGINIPDDLKYTIENNTFFSRKIIEDASLSVEALINKHVNNELALEDKKHRTKSFVFSYDPTIYDVLKDKTIKKKNILPEQLNLAYDELTTKFKEEQE